MTRTSVLAPIFAVALVLFGATATMAQSTSAFMLIPGIPGDSTTRNYENWIPVASVQQSFSGARRANPCTVDVTKLLDRSGPLLWAAAVTNQTFTEITIDILKTGGDQYRFYQLTLTNAMVQAITSAPSSLNEQLTLTGTAATLKFFPQLGDGRPGPAAAVSTGVVGSATARGGMTGAGCSGVTPCTAAWGRRGRASAPNTGFTSSLGRSASW